LYILQNKFKNNIFVFSLYTYIYSTNILEPNFVKKFKQLILVLKLTGSLPV